MELNRLEKYKKRYKEFNQEIDSFKSFLSALIKQGNVSIISPYLISQKLSIPETDAYFLLDLAAKEKLMNPKYKVFTTEDAFLLGEYDNKNQIPEKIYNEATSKFVDSENFYIDLVYKLSEK